MDAPGTCTLTAQATDSQGIQTTSAPVTLTVDTPPTVTLISPTAGTVLLAPASFTITATATDSDGIAKVDFFQNGTLIGTATTPPYTTTVSNVHAGTYRLTARATDILGIQTTSAPINLTLVANSPPTITLTSPSQGGEHHGPGEHHPRCRRIRSGQQSGEGGVLPERDADPDRPQRTVYGDLEQCGPGDLRHLGDGDGQYGGADDHGTRHHYGDAGPGQCLLHLPGSPQHTQTGH